MRRILIVLLGVSLATWTALAGLPRLIIDDDEYVEMVAKASARLKADQKLLSAETLRAQVQTRGFALKPMPLAKHKLEGPELCDLLRGSTLAVGSYYKCPDCGEWHFNGSAGFIVGDGIVCTCCHVVLGEDEGVKESYLVAADATGHVFPVQAVLAADTDSDTCFLKLDGCPLKPLALRTEVRAGERVYCLSHPGGYYFMFTQGMVARLNLRPNEVYDEHGHTNGLLTRPILFLNVTTEFAPGSSGAPVVDDAGNVVGQVASIADAGEPPVGDTNAPASPSVPVRFCTATEEILRLADSGLKPTPPTPPLKAEPKPAIHRPSAPSSHRPICPHRRDHDSPARHEEPYNGVLHKSPLSALHPAGTRVCGSLASRPVQQSARLSSGLALASSSPAGPASPSTGAETAAIDTNDPAVPSGAPAAPGYKTSGDVLAAIGLKQIKLITPPTNLPPGIVELKNLEYGKVADRSLRLDLFRPEKQGKPAPGLIFIHGGGWGGGDRTMLRYYAVRYAQKGYVTACISYRLSGDAPFPAAVEDCKCAVRWLRENAGAYQVDPEKIGVIGGSAGGHLAMMVGYSTAAADLEGKGGHAAMSSRVQAVVDFYGVYDMTDPFFRQAGPVVKFLGNKPYDEAPELYARASPAHYLDKKAPPTLILHGSIDDLVPISEADHLAARLKELGVPYIYDRLAGWPHAMDLAEVVNERCQFFMNYFFAKYLPLPN